MKNRKISYFCILTLLIILVTTILPEDAFARRGGSFRGTRSRSINTNKSFGGSRTQNKSIGNRTSKLSPQAARQKYGTPRKTENVTNKDANGFTRNYRVNDYGGYSSGLMRGYMAGTVMSYMHWLPWYGAFWYSSPEYVTNEDGTVEVYPPTFNTTKLIFILLIVGAIILYIRSRKYSNNYNSDEYYNDSESKSSFD